MRPTQISLSRCSSFRKEKLKKAFPPADLSADEKHFSNAKESLKLLDGIIIPYVEKESDMLQLTHDHPALLIIDVFLWQMTKPVVAKMHYNYINLVKFSKT